MLPRLTTIESSLRSFQYKILNNVLFLNERLYKFNVITSPLCSLCKKKERISCSPFLLLSTNQKAVASAANMVL